MGQIENYLDDILDVLEQGGGGGGGSGNIYIEDEFQINLCADLSTFMAQEEQLTKIANATTANKTIVFTLTIESSADIPLGFSTVSSYVIAQTSAGILFHGLNDDPIDYPFRVFSFMVTSQNMVRQLYNGDSDGTYLPLPDDLYATVKIYNTNILNPQ